ncbi:MAG TPA: zinc ribbon domain-containing protein [Steroidobacteraceae bacterium]
MVLTYRYRIKDAARRHLQRQAWAVNQVWNYCGETQNAARRHSKRSPSGFDLIKLTLGSSKLLGLHSDTVQAARAIRLDGDAVIFLGRRYRHGVEYIEVDERLTTQVCFACGARGGPRGREDLVVREWVCGGCGAWHDRDINSAINILVSGRNVGLRKTEIPSLQ